MSWSFLAVWSEVIHNLSVSHFPVKEGAANSCLFTKVKQVWERALVPLREVSKCYLGQVPGWFSGKTMERVGEGDRKEPYFHNPQPLWAKNQAYTMEARLMILPSKTWVIRNVLEQNWVYQGGLALALWLAVCCCVITCFGKGESKLECRLLCLNHFCWVL